MRDNSIAIFLVLSALFSPLVSGCSGAGVQETPKTTMEIQDAKSFSGEVDLPRRKSRSIDYDWSIIMEAFRVGVPTDFDKEKTYGLVVYLDASPRPTLPESWYPVLAEHGLLFIAPYKVGNDQDMKRRTGIAVLARQLMLREYPNIDPTRIYIAGLSGGARTAGAAAFHHPELFSGTIQSVGTDFYKDVPQVRAKERVDTNGNYYGLLYGADDAQVAEAKKNVRFVIISGDKDFRYPNIHDIYYGGYKPEGFQAKFIDVPGMEHSNASPESLKEAILFLEQK